MAKSRDKYIFDVLEIEETCYLLLACFIASREIHVFCAEEANRDLPLLVVYEPRVIKDYLIYLAIRLRMIDDLMKSYGRDHHLPQHDVGEIENLEDGTRQPASIRDACNKIIHATSIKLEESSKDEFKHLQPMITISGVQHGKAWEASLDVKAFVRAALFMANKYDEDWEVSAYT